MKLMILVSAKKIQARKGTEAAARFLARNGVSLEGALWCLLGKDCRI